MKRYTTMERAKHFKKIILSLEGLTPEEWEKIKAHVDKQFHHMIINIEKNKPLVIDGEVMDRSLVGWTKIRGYRD